jgi:hypothetical protein
MEPFFWAPTRKKLPGKHGQQDLIAAPQNPRLNNEAVEMIFISRVARLSL